MHEIDKQTAAEDDLIHIWLYSFEQWGTEQADLYLNALDEGIGFLRENPRLGTDCAHIRSGYRRLHVRNHMVYYRLQPHRIEVVRVLHESMDPDLHLSRQRGS